MSYAFLKLISRLEKKVLEKRDEARGTMASVTGWEVFGKVWNILSVCWKQRYLGKL